MSVLPVMEKLLEGVEVEWKALGEVATLRRGRVMSKEYLAENSGIYPVYSSQTAKNGEIGSIGSYDFDGEFISWTTDGANAGTVFYREGKFSITNVCGLISIRPEINLTYKYLFYWLSIEAQKHVYSGMGNPKLMSHQVEKIPVPIPPLNVQAEIVRILDAFTAYTAELTAELTARKKQYNHYRDQLLSFSETEVEWKTLSTLVDDKFWIMPATPKFDEDGDVPYITSKNVRGGHVIFEKVKFISLEDYKALSKNRPILAGDFLISMIGTIGEIAQVKESDLDFYGQNMYLIRLNKNLINERFFYYFFDCEKMKNYFNAIKNNSGQGYLKANHIDDIKIPVPPLTEQARIVAILDKFDALTASLSEGLPREIELRQKQYEYYRDRLLSIPKPASDAAA